MVSFLSLKGHFEDKQKLICNLVISLCIFAFQFASLTKKFLRHFGRKNKTERALTFLHESVIFMPIIFFSWFCLMISSLVDLFGFEPRSFWWWRDDDHVWHLHLNYGIRQIFFATTTWNKLQQFDAANSDRFHRLEDLWEFSRFFLQVAAPRS